MQIAFKTMYINWYDRYDMLQLKWMNNVAQYITEETVEHG